MGLDKWRLFSGYYGAYSSEAYNDTMRAAERLASTALLLLNRKSEEERHEILAKAQSLTDKLMDVASSDAPLVVTLALLTTLRVHEQLIQQQADKNQP